MSIIKATVFVICVCKAMAWFPQLKQCVIIVRCLALAGTLSLIPVTIIGKTVSPVEKQSLLCTAIVFHQRTWHH